MFFFPCDTAPWTVAGGFGAAFSDLVWDTYRAHGLINHFTTAFLLDVLMGEAEAHAALPM